MNNINTYAYPGIPTHKQTKIIKDCRAADPETDDDKAERIIAFISEKMEVPVEDIKGKLRKREMVNARLVCSFIITKHTVLSLKAIGSHIGGRDHSTVIYQREICEDLMDTQPKFKQLVVDILHELNLG